MPPGEAWWRVARRPRPFRFAYGVLVCRGWGCRWAQMVPMGRQEDVAIGHLVLGHGLPPGLLASTDATFPEVKKGYGVEAT